MTSVISAIIIEYVNVQHMHKLVGLNISLVTFELELAGFYMHIHSVRPPGDQSLKYCVCRDCHGWSTIVAIHKEIFSFNSISHLMTRRWRTCEKVTAGKKWMKISHEV